METWSEVLKTCVPIVVGALIAIVPTSIEKFSDRKYNAKEKQDQTKQEMYVELISLFGKVLKGTISDDDLNLLRNRINLISISGSTAVVKALNEYIATWSKAPGEEQNKKYNALIKEIRVDLGVDKKLNDEFPQIGLVDINVRNTRI